MTQRTVMSSVISYRGEQTRVVQETVMRMCEHAHESLENKLTWTQPKSFARGGEPTNLRRWLEYMNL